MKLGYTTLYIGLIVAVNYGFTVVPLVAGLMIRGKDAGARPGPV